MAMHTHGTLDDAALFARPTTELGRLRGQSMILCLIGLAASAAIGAVGLVFGKPLVEPGVIWQSYLIAYIFWIGLTLGPLAVLMIQHLTGGAWTFPSRRILEAATRNLPLMAVLFIPIAMNLPALYKWAQPVDTLPEEVAHMVHLKAAYLNPSFFYVRAAMFFVDLGRADLSAQQVVEGAGRAARAAAGTEHPPVSPAVRPRPRALRAHRHVHERGLDHVARSGLVLDDFRDPDDRRPGALDDGVHDHRAVGSREVPADVARRESGQLPRPRQADVRVHHAVGVLLGLAAAHHLVREPAGGDSVLPRAPARTVGAHQHRGAPAPVRRCRS